MFKVSKWVVDKVPFYIAPCILVFIVLAQIVCSFLDITLEQSLLFNIGTVGMIIGLIQILAFWITTYGFMTKYSLFEEVREINVVRKPKLVVIKGGKDINNK